MTNYDFFVISTVTPQEISPEPTPRVNQKIWFVVVDDGNSYRPIKISLANGDRWGESVDIFYATAINEKDTAGLKTITPTTTDPGNTATNNDFLAWLVQSVRDLKQQITPQNTLTYNGEPLTYNGQTLTYTP